VRRVEWQLAEESLLLHEGKDLQGRGARRREGQGQSKAAARARWASVGAARVSAS